MASMRPSSLLGVFRQATSIVVSDQVVYRRSVVCLLFSLSDGAWRGHSGARPRCMLEHGLLGRPGIAGMKPT